MPVTVQVEDRGPFTHQDGEGWHVDDFGRLHVQAGKGGNIASYAPGRWLSIVRVASKAVNSNRTGVR